MCARAADVDRELDRIGYKLKPLDIVLVNTARGRRLRPARTSSTRAAAWAARRRCICSRRACRVTGIDGWSWDAPFSFTRKRFAETGDPSIIWEGHKAGREIGYCHMEKLTEPRSAAAVRLQGVLLPGEDRGRLGRLDPLRRHSGELSGLNYSIVLHSGMAARNALFAYAESRLARKRHVVQPSSYPRRIPPA